MIANLWAKVVGIYEIKTVWEKPGNVMISELPDSLGKKKIPILCKFVVRNQMK